MKAIEFDRAEIAILLKGLELVEARHIEAHQAKDLQRKMTLHQMNAYKSVMEKLAVALG